jgi:hypothetical protein
MPRILSPLLPGLMLAATLPLQAVTFPIVDTHQDSCYDTLRAIPPPAPGQPFYGQDAQFNGNQPSYHNNGDGTVSDLNTGLMWVQERGTMTSAAAAIAGAASCRIGGYSDWRMPTIKELYSLIDFRGFCQSSASNSTPYIDTTYFGFAYGDTAIGRLIDCQDWSATRYVGLTMVADTTYFGVNFADGRIKGYGMIFPPGSGQLKQLYHRYVRGNADYGVNDFEDNGDSTVTDHATGLMWSRFDSRTGMNWQAALAWVQAKNAANYCGYNDWRLPNAKELEGIVDYTRAPAAMNPAQRGPAIDTSVFRITAITNEAGALDYPWFWTGTTHLDGPVGSQYTAAVYVTFGRATGWMMLPGRSYYSFLDVHGAGAQRSDPKRGNVTSYPLGYDSLGHPVYGRGPQGDGVRITNYVRLVRNIDTGIKHQGMVPTPSGFELCRASPNPSSGSVRLSYRLATAGPANLSVYDVRGGRVRALIAASESPGRHSLVWDGTDDKGHELSAGVYVCRLEATGSVGSLQVLLTR